MGRGNVGRGGVLSVDSAHGADDVRARGVGGVPSVGVGEQHRSRQFGRWWRGRPYVGTGDCRADVDLGGCRSPGLLAEGLVDVEKGSCRRIGCR